jgi:hypothetical protein
MREEVFKMDADEIIAKILFGLIKVAIIFAN